MSTCSSRVALLWGWHQANETHAHTYRNSFPHQGQNCTLRRVHTPESPLALSPYRTSRAATAGQSCCPENVCAGGKGGQSLLRRTDAKGRKGRRGAARERTAAFGIPPPRLTSQSCTSAVGVAASAARSPTRTAGPNGQVPRSPPPPAPPWTLRSGASERRPSLCLWKTPASTRTHRCGGTEDPRVLLQARVQSGDPPPAGLFLCIWVTPLPPCPLGGTEPNWQLCSPYLGPSLTRDRVSCFSIRPHISRPPGSLLPIALRFGSSSSPKGYP